MELLTLAQTKNDTAPTNVILAPWIVLQCLSWRLSGDSPLYTIERDSWYLQAQPGGGVRYSFSEAGWVEGGFWRLQGSFLILWEICKFSVSNSPLLNPRYQRTASAFVLYQLLHCDLCLLYCVFLCLPFKIANSEKTRNDRCTCKHLTWSFSESECLQSNNLPNQTASQLHQSDHQTP